MWIVRLALRRPYTFVVLALAIILVTPLVLMRTPTDIFPEINIPVVTIAWTYTGLSPLVIIYSASTVPVIQIGLTSDTMSEQELFDLGTTYLRPKFTTVPGAAIPWPYGGKQRFISVDIDSAALQSKGLSPVDIVNAM